MSEEFITITTSLPVMKNKKAATPEILELLPNSPLAIQYAVEKFDNLQDCDWLFDNAAEDLKAEGKEPSDENIAKELLSQAIHDFIQYSPWQCNLIQCPCCEHTLLIAGGLSWGDDPCEIYRALEIINCFELFENPLDQFFNDAYPLPKVKS